MDYVSADAPTLPISEVITFDILMQQVTMATNLSPSFDKWCSLFFALLSGAAAASMLLVAPRGLLNIDTTGATRALSHASASVLSQRGWEPDAQGGPHSTLHCHPCYSLQVRHAACTL